MSPIPCWSLLFLTLLSSFGKLVLGNPISVSEVHSTLYRKVTPEQRTLFFSKFNPYPKSQIPSSNPDAIPIYHYSYKINHEKVPEISTNPDKQTIGFRMPYIPKVENIVNRASSIIFHDPRKSSYTKLPAPAINYPTKSKYPPHATSIIFPSFGMMEYRRPRPVNKYWTSTTTTSTTTPPPEPTTTEIDLTEEFLDWINMNEVVAFGGPSPGLKKTGATKCKVGPCSSTKQFS